MEVVEDVFRGLNMDEFLLFAEALSATSHGKERYRLMTYCMDSGYDLDHCVEFTVVIPACQIL